MSYILVIFCLVLVIRVIRWYKFIQYVSHVCYLYDKDYTYKNNDAAVEKLTIKKYYKKCDWSAYKFLFFDGPNPFIYLFSFKKLDIYKIYDNELVRKVLFYENI